MLTQDSNYDDTNYKTEIIQKIKYLLAKVELTPRAEKYQYVVQIYDCLGSNKKFVTENQVFYLTLKKKANSLIKDMLERLIDESLDSSETVSSSRAILSIVNCVKLLDENN